MGNGRCRLSSYHFEHIEHGAEQGEGEAACRYPQPCHLDPCRLAAAFFISPETTCSFELGDHRSRGALTLLGSRTHPRDRHAQHVHRLSRTASGTCEEVRQRYPPEIAGVSEPPGVSATIEALTGASCSGKHACSEVGSEWASRCRHCRMSAATADAPACESLCETGCHDRQLNQWPAVRRAMERSVTPYVRGIDASLDPSLTSS